MSTTVIKATQYDPEPVSREQAAAELGSFPEHLAHYRDAIAAWQATGAAKVPDQLLAEGLSVYHVLRRYDLAWALDVRNGRIPMDWEETRRICGLYAQWREATVAVLRALGPEPLDYEESLKAPAPIPAFRHAFLRASFAAHTDVDEMREASEWCDRWIASHSGGRKPDAVGR
jgi:hypothetical protein